MKFTTAFLFGLFLSGNLSAQEKCKLEIRYQAGQKVTRVEKETIETNITSSIGEHKREHFKLEISDEELVEEILAVDKDGNRTRSRNTYKRKRTDKTDKKGGEKVTAIDPLEGKSFVVTRNGEKVEYGEVPEGLDEALLQKHKLENSFFFRYFPAGDVSVGQTWEVPEEDMVKHLTRNKPGSYSKIMTKGVLRSIKANVAEIYYKIDWEGKDENGFDFVGDLSFTVQHDHKMNRILSSIGTGTMKLTGTSERKGHTIQIKALYKAETLTTNSYE